jgi:hypothetical protein
VDPDWLTLDRALVWTKDIVVVDTQRWKGTRGVRHQCIVRRTGARLTADCKQTATMVS